MLDSCCGSGCHPYSNSRIAVAAQGNTSTVIPGSTMRPANSSAVVNNPNSIDRLNLRTKPGQDAPTLGKYYSGTPVEVLGGDQNGWTKVRIHTLEGYMMTQYLAFGQDQSGSRLCHAICKN